MQIGNKYLNDGDTINITDIGEQPMDLDDTGSALVCNTIFVNLKCCRRMETGNKTVGNWYPHTGRPVITYNKLGNTTNTIYRVVNAQQVRLGSIGFPYKPLGIYSCRVPDKNQNSVNISVNIINVFTGKQ